MNFKVRTPATEVLLLCARPPAEDVEAPLRRVAPAIEDWPALADRMVWHGLTIAAHRRLRDICPHPETGERLRRLALLHAGRAAQLTGELLRILEALERAGIEAAVIKGPALARLAYGETTRREFVDLDLLARPADIPAAVGVMEAEGYRLQAPLSARQINAYLRSGREWKFVRQEKAVHVHLNTAVVSHAEYPLLDPAGWLDRAITVELDGRRVRTTSPEDTLRMLCAHGAEHAWDRLSLVADLSAFLVSDVGPDLESVAAEARRTGGARMLRTGLLLANALLGAALPEGAMADAKQDAQAVRLAAEAADRLTSASMEEMRPAAIWWFVGRSFDHRLESVRYWRRQILVPSVAEWRLIALPAALYPLYYVLRPLRLAWALTRRRTRAQAGGGGSAA